MSHHHDVCSTCCYPDCRCPGDEKKLTSTKKVQLQEKVEKRDEFISLEDGYIYYYPKGYGALHAGELRMLADILDEKNKDWNAQVHTELRKLEVQHE